MRRGRRRGSRRTSGPCSAPLLNRLDHLPEGLLEATAPRLHRVLSEPTLLRLAGRGGPALLVVVLQHGNEDTGLTAVQRLLRGYEGALLPRPLWLFVANPQAARHGTRARPRGPDLNRCWPGTGESGWPEITMLREVVDTVAREPLLASIDIHNTTGVSPYHGGINRLSRRFLQLGHWFARTLVYFDRPQGVQSLALAAYCPAVTLECGRPGNADAAEHTRRFLQHCLECEAIPDEAPTPGAIDLYRSIARVFVADSVDFAFGYQARASLALDPRLDELNFRELPAGTVLAHTRCQYAPVRAVGPNGLDCTDELLSWSDGRLRLRRTLMPSLLSRDPDVVRGDCLGQFMQRMPHARLE